MMSPFSQPPKKFKISGRSGMQKARLGNKINSGGDGTPAQKTTRATQVIKFHEDVKEYLSPNVDVEKSMRQGSIYYKQARGPKRKGANYSMVTRSMIGNEANYNEAIQIREDRKKQKRLERQLLKQQMEQARIESAKEK